MIYTKKLLANLKDNVQKRKGRSVNLYELAEIYYFYL